MKELLRRESRIVPCTIRREGEGYNSLETGRGFSSASAIRHALFAAEGEEGDKKRQQALEGLPAYAVSCLDGSGPLVCADDFSEMLFARLLYEEHPECYASVTEDLANRLRRNVRNCHTFTELADALKTRNLTRTRVNRALLHILLGIRKGDARKCVRPEIVRLLGMRGAEPSFHTIHAAAGVKLSASVAKMPEEIYGADRRASDLYEWVRSAKAGEPMRPEATRMPVKI
jgi:predicted nucleotidyltransferase